MVASLKGSTSTQWDKLSRWHRRRNPLCAECLRQGRTTAATCVDHVKPHRGDVQLLLDRSNLQSLCDACHSAKKQQRERLGFNTDVGADGWPTDPMHPANRKM